MSKAHLKYLKNEVIEDVTTIRLRQYEATYSDVERALQQWLG